MLFLCFKFELIIYVFWCRGIRMDCDEGKGFRRGVIKIMII